MGKRPNYLIVFFGLVMLLRLLPVFSENIQLLNGDNDPNVFQKILERNLTSLLPSPEADLLSGIVLGSKKNLSQDLYNQLEQTGTLHIIVASGMNISLLAGFLFGFLAIFFKRKIVVPVLLVMIWFYAYITGMDPPIIRAVIMLSLVYLAQEQGRPADSLRILIMTGYVMVLFKPALINNLSFQLSFISALGLVIIQPLLRKSKARFLRNEGFSSTLACQIATLPIVLSNFGEYNLISIMVNFLVLWTVPLVLQFGLQISFCCLFFRPLAQLLSYLVYPLLKYFVIVIQVFSRIKLFQFWIPRFGFWWGAGYYFVLGWLLYKKQKRQ